MVEFKVGHYYKRTWDRSKHKYTFVFKVVDIYRHDGWLLVSVLKDLSGNHTNPYEIVTTQHEHESNTVELIDDIELMTALL